VSKAAVAAGRVAKVGYNHRFHPAVLKAREIVDRGELGQLMFIRGRYGHGGRPGYEREWRFERSLSGGGELIDQGSHLIDLAHWFLGEFIGVQAALRTFWNTEVEDNVFLTLSTADGRIALAARDLDRVEELVLARSMAAMASPRSGLGGSCGSKA
jgi:predicted dehydrogenase